MNVSYRGILCGVYFMAIPGSACPPPCMPCRHWVSCWPACTQLRRAEGWGLKRRTATLITSELYFCSVCTLNQCIVSYWNFYYGFSRLCLPSPMHALSALGLLLTSMYTAEEGRGVGSEEEDSHHEMQPHDPEEILLAMERVSIMFDRLAFIFLLPLNLFLLKHRKQNHTTIHDLYTGATPQELVSSEVSHARWWCTPTPLCKFCHNFFLRSE